MNQRTRSATLQRLMDVTKKDAQSIRSCFPHQLFLALMESTVQEALEKRFAEGEVLTGITLLQLQSSTGLIPLYFTFAPSASIHLASRSILVNVDHRCRVTLADDEFVPARPNPVSDAVASIPKSPLALDALQRHRRRLDTPVAREQLRLGHEMLVHHGLLSKVKVSELKPSDNVFFETDSTVEKTIYIDTIVHVKVTYPDGSTDEFDDTQQDPSTEEQSVLDDSGQMTVGDLVDQYGPFPF